MTRMMGIDYGETRIGISLTDPLRIIVSPFLTLQNGADIFDKIKDIVISKVVSEIVIGIPYGKDSEITENCKKIIIWSKKLFNYLSENGIKDIKFYFQDERYTTIDAYNMMSEIKVKNKNKKQLVDQIASCNILKSFIDSKYKEEVNFEKITF